LEREGDEIKVHESRRERRRREKRERREERQLAEQLGDEPRRSLRLPSLGVAAVADRPVATMSVLAIAGVLIILQRAIPWDAAEIGAIAGPVGDEVWRYVVAPFVYDDLGALIVIGAAIALFGSLVEARIGSLAAAVLILACGTGGMLAADASAEIGLQGGFHVAAGGNGVALGLLAAWLMLWRGDQKSTFAEPADLLGVSVIAVVLLLLPVVEITADPIAGLVGGAIGLILGWLAAVRLPAANR
jgi:membrane associated rhomboid family serine protease